MLVITNNLFNIFGSLMLGALAAVVFNHHGLQGSALNVFDQLHRSGIVLGEIVPKALAPAPQPALPCSQHQFRAASCWGRHWCCCWSG